jgi:hypothetical protein
MINGNTVATLTFNQLQGGNHQNQDGLMFNQHRDHTNGVARGRFHVNSIAASS